jgi:hypothetical protein
MFRPTFLYWLFLSLFATSQTYAEESKTGPIQDNSFLIEEAYNQEAGVVQHISTFQRFQNSKDWGYSFTQEWPVGGQTHQFSYTIPLSHLNASPDGGRTGVGDIALNYRYQLVGDGEAKLAVSPRFSVLLPTGDEKQGRGTGATGYQVAIPLSWAATESLVAHTNVGYTWTPNAKDPTGVQANLQAWNVGQSVIWLAQPRLNFMLEWIYNHGQTVAGPGATTPISSAYLSPGIRWAYDFPSGLQIVPGIAMPIGVGPSRGEKSIFLYLSFEHPFK